MKKWDAVNACYKFISEREDQKRAFSIQDIVSATGWKEATVKTYINKRWNSKLVAVENGKFKSNGIASLGIEGFKALHTQKTSDTFEPYRPKFTEEVDALIDKSRDAALLAVATFNNPFLKFRSHGFIVQMMIGWCSLFHAVFERRGIPYYYKDDDGNPKIIDGENKAWELSKCVKEYWKDEMLPARSNLDFFIGLRNKIEHRFLPALDATISGKCQSLLLNYEKVLVQEFGSYFSLNSSLAISLQLTHLAEKAYSEARKTLHSSNYQLVSQYVTQFDQSLPKEIVLSQDYQIKVFLVPRLGNHASSSDVTVQFVKYDETDPDAMKDYENMVALIREKPSSHSVYKKRPSHVVDEVKSRSKRNFTIQHHTNAWKLYAVRPKGNAKGDKCKKDYCDWVEGYEGYLYTDAWITFLCSEISDDEKFSRIKTYRG